MGWPAGVCGPRERGSRMWRLSRRLAPVASIPDAWSVEAAGEPGRLLVVRWNCFAASIRGHQDYPYQAGVAIPFLAEDGAPNQPSLERLAEFEGALGALVQTGLAAILCAVVTTERMREFVIYTGEPELTVRRVESLRDRTSDLVVQCICRRDPRWRVLRGVLPRGGGR